MNPLLKKIAAQDNLRQVAADVKKKHFLLRDREWMGNDLEKKLKKLGSEIINEKYLPISLSYYFSFYKKPILSAKLDCRDLIASQAILRVLENEMVKSAVPHCHFRMEKTESLLRKCREWKDQNGWVLVTDVERFFASARHDFILGHFGKRCPGATNLVKKYLDKLDEAGAGFSSIEPGFENQKGRGLPIGIELFYLFAHALLHSIDLTMSSLDWKVGYGRYIDDLIVFTKNKEECEAAFLVLENEMSNLSLRLNEGKTTMQPCSEALRFLRADL